jgi:hypothetical protein
MTSVEHRHIIKRFIEEKKKMEGAEVPFRKNYDENDECRFETLESIRQCPNLWPMIRQHVLENQEFRSGTGYDTLDTVQYQGGELRLCKKSNGRGVR